MPPAPNERDFYEEILVSMGGVLVAGISITTLRHRARILARQLEVNMLIIDEIHSILAGTFREQHDARQALMTNAILRSFSSEKSYSPSRLMCCQDTRVKRCACSESAIMWIEL
jgi:hypothetical protein